MVEIVVTQEAGRRWDAVADEVRAVATGLAERVGRRTGLGLGPELHVRLLNPDAYALAHEAHERRVNEALLASDLLYAIPDQARRLRLEADLRRADGSYSGGNRKFGCLPSSRAVPGTDGGSTILLVPALLRRSAGTVSRDALRSVLAHQLVHQAQFALWGPSLSMDLRAAHLVHRATRAAVEEFRSLSAVLEGHARFTTRELLAADYVEERKAGRLLRLLWGPNRGLAVYDRGEDCVRKAVEYGVTDLLLRLRADPTLVPDRRELLDPDGWVARLTTADEPVRQEPAGPA
ncbi:hypothetical protein ACIF6L_13955 [Kitasatospora sp. NPDC086009]|uniref:hypothetical protein n=1 Tax=unclassified Kitasatospora TaxID=2633591 RepID=UPI0037CBF5DD